MTLKYPVRVRHLIGKEISVRFEPDQAFSKGAITAGAVSCNSHGMTCYYLYEVALEIHIQCDKPKHYKVFCNSAVTVSCNSGSCSIWQLSSCSIL